MDPVLEGEVVVGKAVETMVEYPAYQCTNTFEAKVSTRHGGIDIGRGVLVTPEIFHRGKNVASSGIVPGRT